MTDQQTHSWERAAPADPEQYVCARCGVQHQGPNPPAGPCTGTSQPSEFPPGIRVGSD